MKLLASAIRDVTSAAVDPPGRDDGGAFTQMRQRNLDGVDGADQVRVDHVALRLQRWCALHARDAGLRHHDVEFAEFGQAVVQRGPQLRHLAHISLRRHDALAGLLDEAGGLVEIFRLFLLRAPRVLLLGWFVERRDGG